MIRLNRMTDYAVVALSLMARAPGRRMSAAEMARETGVPMPTVQKLLKTLASGGVVISHRGASGGYALSKAPADTTMGEVIQALEGPIALTACVSDDSDCEVETVCPMRGNWDRVNHAIQDALAEVSLADMAWANPWLTAEQEAELAKRDSAPA